MSTTILHISDIHFDGLKEKNSVLSKLQNFTESVALHSEYENILCIISGDIAKSGQISDYEIASLFLNEFQSSLSARGKKLDFIICPGNHDLNLEEDQSTREAILKDTWPQKYNEQNVGLQKTLLAPQKTFREFAAKFGNQFQDDEFVHVIDHNLIHVHVVNTAMVSTKKELKGQMYIPVTALNKLKKEKNKLNITVFHHPYSWFHNTISTQIKTSVSTISDIIITGHEHHSDLYEKKPITQKKSELYFEGSVFQDSKNSNVSSFSIFNFDSSANTLNSVVLNWEDSSYKATPCKTVLLSEQGNTLGLVLREEYIKDLNDPGPGIIHGKLKNLTLEDFYVFPKLKYQKSSVPKDGESLSSIDSQQDLLEILPKLTNAIISGDDNSGKTSLVKVIFKTLVENNFAPLIINGKDLSSLNSIHFKNKLEEKIKETYEDQTFDSFFQIEFSRRILIFDNADQNRQTKSLHKQIFALSEKYFAKKFLIVSTEYSSEMDLLSYCEEKSGSADYESFRIQEFAAPRRRELVTKWLNLGMEDINQDQGFQKSQIEKLLNSYVLEFQIPKYPVFIISLLQQVETEKDFTLKCASNAKLFEMMVTYAMAHASKQEFKIQTKQNYLSSLAFHLNQIGTDFISKELFRSFHDEYCEKNDLTLNYDKLVDELLESKIVCFNHSKFGFKYEYFKYFYVAVYLNKNITHPKIKEQIEKITQDIHIYENANILTFLSLFSNDPSIVTTAISKLSACLSTFNEGTFSSFSRSVGDLHKIEFSEFEKHESSHHQDKKDEDVEVENFGNKDYDPKDCTNHIGYCLRVMKILGQILKNSFDTIEPSQKVTIVEEVYKLSLRIVELFTRSLKANQNEIINHFAEHIRKNHPELTSRQVYSDAKRQVSILSFYSAYGIIYNVSKCIGTEDLKITYDKVFKHNDLLPGLEQVIADSEFFLCHIKIENFKDFPFDQLEKLYKRVSKDPFMSHVVKSLVKDSLTTTRKDNKEIVHEVCKILEIHDMKDIKKIYQRQEMNRLT